jgi:MFS family permease
VLVRWLRGILPPTRLERDLALQCVLSAFATGSFLTGTAVFFTQLVGLTGAQVGLGMSIAAGVTLLLQLPLGRLADRVGAKPLWVLASAVEAVLYFAWPFIGGMLGFVAMLSVLAVFETAGRNARNVYRIAVFPRETRVRALAYMRAARNVGYTLGAGASGVALGIGLDAVRLIPVVTGGLLVVNAVMIAAMLPAITRTVHVDTVEDGLTASPAAWRNVGFVVLAACNGVLSSNQVLLNIVVPLWLVERTDAPPVLLAWLFGTNTVLAVLLQVRASRVADWLGLRRVLRPDGGHPRHRRLDLDRPHLGRSRDHHRRRALAVGRRLGPDVRALRPPSPRRLPGRVGPRLPGRAHRLPGAVHLPRPRVGHPRVGGDRRHRRRSRGPSAPGRAGRRATPRPRGRTGGRLRPRTS